MGWAIAAEMAMRPSYILLAVAYFLSFGCSVCACAKESQLSNSPSVLPAKHYFGRQHDAYEAAAEFPAVLKHLFPYSGYEKFNNLLECFTSEYASQSMIRSNRSDFFRSTLQQSLTDTPY